MWEKRVMNSCVFHTPHSLVEATSLFQAATEASYLSGGQTLVQAMKLGLISPSELVSLQRVNGLTDIEKVDGRIRIGAMASHDSVGQSILVRENIPGLTELANGIGDPSVRSRGTIGGSIANADPAACYPAALVALDAIVLTNIRRIPATKFFLGLYSTALQYGEIVTGVEFPIAPLSAYVKFRHPASRFAIVGVFMTKAGADVRVATTGAQAFSQRVGLIEKALNDRFDITSLKNIVIESKENLSDAFASPRYRAALVLDGAAKAVARINQMKR
jgi:aerobic carbon-monoxide dehydrogenase medium subunit